MPPVPEVLRRGGPARRVIESHEAEPPVQERAVAQDNGDAFRLHLFEEVRVRAVFSVVDRGNDDPVHSFLSKRKQDAPLLFQIVLGLVEDEVEAPGVQDVVAPADDLGENIGAGEESNKSDVRRELRGRDARTAESSDSPLRLHPSLLGKVTDCLPDGVSGDAKLGAKLAFRGEFFSGGQLVFDDVLSDP